MIAALTFLLLSTPTPDDAFKMGIAAYEEGDVQSSRRAFEYVLREHPDHATLYNYGNVLARDERWAEALAAYRSAQRRRPRDADVQHNINIVRERLGQSKPSLTTRGVELILPHETLALMLLVSVAFAIAACVYGLRGRTGARVAVWSAAAAFLLAAGLHALSVREARTQRAVILLSTAAQSDPSVGGASLFAVPPGTEVVLGEQRTDWTRVSVQGRWVWIRTGSLQPLW